MQYILNEWEAVAKCTGGALVPRKCWSWILKFDWKNDFWSYADTTTSSSSILTIKDPYGVTTKLSKLKANKAKEMLGVFLAPDGNNEAQINKLKQRMSKLAEYIRAGHVSRHEAWISLTMVAFKSLEYCTPSMTVSKKDYDEILKPLLKQYLPKIGINRNIRRDLLFAPLSVQGFNLTHPYVCAYMSTY